MTDRIQSGSSCGVCGSGTQVPGYGEQFGTLSARWGYGSRHDGEHYRVTLCEGCFLELCCISASSGGFKRCLTKPSPGMMEILA